MPTFKIIVSQMFRIYLIILNIEKQYGNTVKRRQTFNQCFHKHIKNKKRILITGCPIGTATEKVIKAIENAGGVVVCYENCAGAKAIDENVDLSNADIINAIAEKYLRIGCACITPNDNRVRLLDSLIDEYHVDGVVDMHLQTCTPYQVEARRIKLFTTGEKNVPYIAIDTDYSQSDVGQLGTRLEAFLEML